MPVFVCLQKVKSLCDVCRIHEVTAMQLLKQLSNKPSGSLYKHPSDVLKTCHILPWRRTVITFSHRAVYLNPYITNENIAKLRSEMGRLRQVSMTLPHFSQERRKRTLYFGAVAEQKSIIIPLSGMSYRHQLATMSIIRGTSSNRPFKKTWHGEQKFYRKYNKDQRRMNLGKRQIIKVLKCPTQYEDTEGAGAEHRRKLSTSKRSHTSSSLSVKGTAPRQHCPCKPDPSSKRYCQRSTGMSINNINDRIELHNFSLYNMTS